MTNGLKKIPVSRLQKFELPNFTRKVLGVCEKHDAEELKINEHVEILEGMRPQLAYLVASYGPHPLTKKLNQLHKKRINDAGVIVDQVAVYERAGQESMIAALELVRFVLANTLLRLNQNTRIGATERINDFFLQVDKSQELEEAFSELKLTGYLNELRTSNLSFQQLENMRAVDIASRPKTNIPPIVKEVNAGLRNLLSHITLSQSRYPEVDYSQFIDELNVVITSFDAVIKSRETRNKNKAEEAKRNEENVNDGEEHGDIEQPEANTTNVNGMYPKNVLRLNGEENGKLDLSINEKKTTTSSSKPMQLPDNKNDKDN